MLRKNITAVAFILCFAMLLNIPAHPLAVFAAVDGQEELPEDMELPDVDEYDADGPSTGQEETLPDDDGEEPESQTQTSASYDSVGNKYQGQIDQITEKQKELEAERAMIERNINSAKTAKEKEQSNKAYIDQQINITQSEIDLLYERIEILEQDIEDKILSIEEKQLEYDQNYAQFLKRLRGMQLSGEATQLGAILGSDNFADYLSTNEMMGRIADYDKSLMDRVREERIALEAERADLENNMLLVEADKEEAESKKQVLAVQRQSAVLKIQDIEEMQRQFMADLEANKKMSAEMQAELDQIYKQIEWDKNPYRGGTMMWPVPGYSSITSRYGWRWGNSDFHTGMDISGSGIHGKPIVSAGTGRVAFVNTSYTAGRGYGIYVIIDHGGGISTLYGHCSSVAVGVGQEVSAGDTIAYVGSTGWSTGPHLHFEVRVNSAHTNPEPYLLG